MILIINKEKRIKKEKMYQEKEKMYQVLKQLLHIDFILLVLYNGSNTVELLCFITEFSKIIFSFIKVCVLVSRRGKPFNEKSTKGRLISRRLFRKGVFWFWTVVLMGLGIREVSQYIYITI